MEDPENPEHQQPATFRIVERTSGWFRDTLVCEANDCVVLRRQMLTLDVFAAPSIAFYRKAMEPGERINVSITRKSGVVAGALVDAEWVASNAKGYRRWAKASLGRIPNMPHL